MWKDESPGGFTPGEVRDAEWTPCQGSSLVTSLVPECTAYSFLNFASILRQREEEKVDIFI